MTREAFPHLAAPQVPFELLRPVARITALIVGLVIAAALLFYVANESPTVLALLGRAQ